ncbi:Syntaxin 6 [Gracilaria domingensis]|nr:Syntaxin 6 [Gracilaria domingensis]
MTQEDPFPIVQEEVRAAWASLSKDLSHISETQYQARVQTLECDVKDLSDAVQIAKQDRQRFGLSEHEIASRQHFVTDMQRNILALRKRAEIAPSNATSRADEIRRANDSFIGSELRQQEMLMEHQDVQLGELASAVERIGIMGRDMHQELEEQGQMLDDLGDEMVDARSRMKSVHRKLNKFIEETGPRNFCTIVGLCITFIVLTILVVTT